MTHVICQHCDGLGKVQLTPPLASTLDAVKQLRQATSGDVAEVLKWSGTDSTICNRLKQLMALNLVKRHRKGLNFVYSIA